ncbi:MAG: hypothetical protein J0L77_05660 [Alphaproteobacteria bacterium]|nr:hypothetical protein [Alphaproteobacteria bacterium]
MSESCLVFGFHCDAISSVATLLILAITFLANKKLTDIYKYNLLQNDRKIIEQVYQLQFKAEKLFKNYSSLFAGLLYSIASRDLDKEFEILDILKQANAIAHLYNLTDIEKHLEKIDASCRSTFSASIMDKFNVKESIVTLEYFADIKCYQNKIEVKNY